MKIHVLLILLAFCCTVAQAQIVTDGLVGYWTFDNADIKGDEVSRCLGEQPRKDRRCSQKRRRKDRRSVAIQRLLGLDGDSAS